MTALETLPRKRIEEFCRDRGINRLAFFGSIVRNDILEDSDVDVIVNFLPGIHKRSYERHIAIELEKIVGRKIDLLVFSDIEKMKSGVFRNHILNTMVEYYNDGT